MKPNREESAPRSGAGAHVPSRRRATLKDVARKVGVSATTVSVVINDLPRAKVYSEETRNRIRAAAKELSYFPNPLAKILKKSRSGLLGLVLYNQQSMYYALSIQAADEQAKDIGYDVVTADMHYDFNRLDECLRLMAAWRVEGIFVMTGGHPLDAHAIQLLDATGVPYVKGGFRQADEQCSSIIFDNYQAGRLLTKHIVDLGHVSIGVLAANETNHQAEERLRGVIDVISTHNIPLDNLTIVRAVDANIGLQAGYHYAGQLIEKGSRITALICMNDRMAIGAMRRLREHGKRIAEDISVAGFDDLCLDRTATDEDRLGAYLWPPLTTIRTPLDEVGRGAVNMLVEMIGDPRLATVRRTLEFSPELIVRQSTGPCPHN